MFSLNNIVELRYVVLVYRLVVINHFYPKVYAQCSSDLQYGSLENLNVIGKSQHPGQRT